MAHVDNGWPHYRNDRCICLDLCCHDPNNGCICKTCQCRIEEECHGNSIPFILSEDAQAILDGTKEYTVIDMGDSTMGARYRPIESQAAHSGQSK